ncbi:MAG: biotin/lipoyl-containing protein [Bacteroidota bacterium]
MELELNLEGRKAILKEISREGNLLTVSVDDEIYTVDLVKVGPAEYSVLHKGRSYNIEVVPGREPKHYTVNTFYFSHEIEVVDAETRYIRSRENATGGHVSNIIRSPMPGKIVKILVSVGDTVEVGQTVIIVSAMKMESEFKATKAGTVKEIPVNENDTVDSNQILVVIEDETI